MLTCDKRRDNSNERHSFKRKKKKRKEKENCVLTVGDWTCDKCRDNSNERQHGAKAPQRPPKDDTQRGD